MSRLTTCVVIISCVVLTFVQGQDTTLTRRPAAPFLSQYDSTVAVINLGQRLDKIFDTNVYRKSKVSCAVWSVTRNKLLYERNADQCLTPASTTKLFTTAAAFHALGRDGTIDTEVRATGKIDSAGLLHGDLYLVGHGDALMTINDIEYLADVLFRAGIRAVAGHVYGDGSFFDNVTDRALYSGDSEDVEKLGPITALGLHKNTIAVVVSASSKGIISAQTIPASDALRVEPIQTKVRGKTNPAPVRKKQRYGDAPPDPEPRQRKRRKRARKVRAPRVSVVSVVQPNGFQLLQYKGSPGRNRTVTLYVGMYSPALVAAGALSNRMRSGGISVSDTVFTKVAPASSRVIATFRRPLTDIVSIVNKRSDNYLAEHVFKIVGGLYGGQTNTADRARNKVLATLDSLRVERNGSLLNDGSGLSRRNKVCALTQVSLLNQVANSGYGDVFKSTLSIAGVDGTLRRRMLGTFAANNAHGKTGTLRNTSSISGYVTTLDGEQLAFSFISNGANVRSYKAAENIAITVLANYSYDSSRTQPVPITFQEVEADSAPMEPEYDFPEN
ncbi:MAG: D-alanyl-D-alanine carboxypeptidase/D-alanyl-D-alanine-endopeptidase [Ignavibacteria bacterium]|nr:D-alanyl-D-alanine carboxypeptidase/D-alanyl-D-alanine-endopeptidase [Ignavibacteria bacterium]